MRCMDRAVSAIVISRRSGMQPEPSSLHEGDEVHGLNDHCCHCGSWHCTGCCHCCCHLYMMGHAAWAIIMVIVLRLCWLSSSSSHEGDREWGSWVGGSHCHGLAGSLLCEKHVSHIITHRSLHPLGCSLVWSSLINWDLNSCLLLTAYFLYLLIQKCLLGIRERTLWLPLQERGLLEMPSSLTCSLI
jgi:hypothetical protein